MKGTAAHIVRTLLLSLITLFGVSVLIFLMLRVLPGDPARVLAGLNASEEQVAQIRQQLGLDETVQRMARARLIAYGELAQRLTEIRKGWPASTEEIHAEIEALTDGLEQCFQIKRGARKLEAVAA